MTNFRYSWSILGFLFLMNLGNIHSLAAMTPEETFTQANTAFISGKYGDAIRDYESLITQKKYSVPLFYNLANAYFRDGKIGPAIINYERALWLAPNDADIKANLRFVRRSAGLFESSPPWWQIVPGWMTLNQWAVLSLTLFALICTAFIVRMFQSTWSRRSLIFLFVFAWTIAISSTMIRAALLNQAIVLVPETPLQIAPLEKALSSSTLAGGNMVMIEKQRDAFLFVHTQDGKTGWVHKNQIQRIVPISTN